jgi:hypothetical protein
MNNPMQFMNMLKGFKNPKDAVISMIKSNNNPMIKNLVEMAENGNSKGVEEFARNLYAQQGRDFDKEFGEFMNNFK